MQPDRSGDEHPVEAVNDRAQANLLAAREPELGDVGKSQTVGFVGAELPIDEILRRLRYLADIRTVAPGAAQSLQCS